MTEGGALTGVTVIVPPIGTRGSVDVRGGAPGTRETDLLDPVAKVDRVDAVVFAGGSAYGLAAAGGVMEALEDQGRGWAITQSPGGVVPIVPSAVIFDLARGGDFAAQRPDREAGMAAFDAATADPVALGSVGAGTGAEAGGLRGGIGSASAVLPSGATVAALLVVNPAGSVVDPTTGRLYADRFALEGGPRGGDVRAEGRDAYNRLLEKRRAALGLGQATTIGVIVTDYALSKAQCAKLASIGHDGLARAIDPVHTMLDGDTLFGLATGSFRQGEGSEPDLGEEFDLLSAAASCVARAVARAVLEAAPGGSAPTYREMFLDG